MTLRDKTIVNIFATFVFVIGITSCAGKGDSHTAHEDEEHHNHGELVITEKQLKTVGIELGSISEKEIGTGVAANGILELNPQDMAEVAPLLSGLVKTLYVKEGSYVSAGTIVAKIENLEVVALQKDYQDALEELKLAGFEKNRQESLASAGAGVKKNLENAQTSYQIAQNKVKSLESQLRFVGIDARKAAQGIVTNTATVSAPISGVVNKIFTQTGGFADMSRPLMTISDNSKIFVNLTIYEKDLSKIVKGESVDINLVNSNETLTGVVSDINRTIDSETKGVNVKVAIIAGEKKDLIPGMAVSAVINTGMGLTSVLPEGAIVTKDGKDYIYLLEATKEEAGEKVYHFEAIEVATGSRQHGFVEVKPLQDLGANAIVVTDKAYYLSSMEADHGEHNH